MVSAMLIVKAVPNQLTAHSPNFLLEAMSPCPMQFYHGGAVTVVAAYGRPQSSLSSMSVNFLESSPRLYFNIFIFMKRGLPKR